MESLSREPMNFSGKRILVTGSSGFLGKHVVSALKAAGADTLCCPTHAERDLSDPKDCFWAFRDFNPDIVIHLAAVCGGIGANRARPADFWADNLAMGANVLKQSAKHKVKRLVMVGTTCSYPRDCAIPFKESDLWNGYPEETNAPYGIAKRALIEGAMAYRQQYGLDTITLIPTNLYGPGDNFDAGTSHIIPAIIKKCADGAESLELWGTGVPTRDFLYVEDCADAIVKACEAPSHSEPINLGSGREISIFDTSKTISDMMGGCRWIYFDKTKPDGQPRRLLDTTKAEAVLGWKATTILEYGIRKTIDWYLSRTETKRQCP